MTLTDAERWELLCWVERVKSARIHLAVAEDQQQQALRRVLASHGADVTQTYTLTDAGELVLAKG